MLTAMGCTSDELREWIESHFEDWMTWGNIGVTGSDGWQIDHVVPCAAFNHLDKEDVKLCWNYQNLRPLSAEENASKGDVIRESDVEWLSHLDQTNVVKSLTTRALLLK